MADDHTDFRTACIKELRARGLKPPEDLVPEEPASFNDYLHGGRYKCEEENAAWSWIHHRVVEDCKTPTYAWLWHLHVCKSPEMELARQSMKDPFFVKTDMNRNVKFKEAVIAARDRFLAITQSDDREAAAHASLAHVRRSDEAAHKTIMANTFVVSHEASASTVHVPPHSQLFNALRRDAVGG